MSAETSVNKRNPLSENFSRPSARARLIANECVAVGV